MWRRSNRSDDLGSSSILCTVRGALLGGLLLGAIPDLILVPALAVILLVSGVADEFRADMAR